MGYAKTTSAIADYYGDPEDTDKFFWGAAMTSVPVLSPGEDWRHDYRALLMNRSPRDGSKLRARGVKVTDMSHALTSPKCVSVLELLNIDERVGAAVEKAARVCLDFSELIVAPAGQKPDGLKPSPVVCAMPIQRLTDSHPRMPHRHPHLTVLSLAWNEQRQQTTAAELGVFMHARRLLQYLYQHQLAWELTQLGYGIVRERYSFTIEGFPREVVDQFLAGPRERKAKDYDRLPEGYFKEQQQIWRNTIGLDCIANLRKLDCRPVPPAEPRLGSKDMIRTAGALLTSDFFVPVDAIASEVLWLNFGRPPMDIHALAQWVTGGTVDGLDVRAFALNDRWCWGEPRRLATEREFLSLISKLPLADHGWLPAANAATSWERQLAEDRHRVAILKKDLDWDAQQELRKNLGESGELHANLRELPVALMTADFMESLRAGKRLLILDAEKPKSHRPWLDYIHRCGIPVFDEQALETCQIGEPYGLQIEFRKGYAAEVFASAFSHRPHAYLLVHHAGFESSIAKVRRLRAKAAKRPVEEIQRLCLSATDRPPRAGLFAQFSLNTGGILATETLRIIRVDSDAFVVDRPNGLQALVPCEQWDRLKIYEPLSMALTKGDRIRLTRNNGHNPQKTGLRAGRCFVVRFADEDGTVHLNGGRKLPPEAGHWDYDFCRPIDEGPPAHRCIALCDVDDLPVLAVHGWLRRKLKVVICAESRDQAEQSLRVVMKGRGNRCLPGTDQIGTALGLEFSRSLKPVDQRVQPAQPDVSIASGDMNEDCEREPSLPPTAPELGI